MTRIWKALAAALLGGAMVLGFGASPASAQLDPIFDNCPEELAAVCEPLEDGLQQIPLDDLLEACTELEAISEELLALCEALGIGDDDDDDVPEETTTTTAPLPPPTDPPAPPATEAPAPAPAAATTGALPSTGGTGTGVALLAGGVLAAGALALRRFAAA